jgi:hypothetical protein
LVLGKHKLAVLDPGQVERLAQLVCQLQHRLRRHLSVGRRIGDNRIRADQGRKGFEMLAQGAGRGAHLIGRDCTAAVSQRSPNRVFSAVHPALEVGRDGVQQPVSLAAKVSALG